MLKNIFIKIMLIGIILSNSYAVTNAGSAKNSWGGDGTAEKFGSKKLQISGRIINIAPSRVSATINPCADSIYIETKSSVRFKNWLFLVKEFKSGYAETKVTQCNKPFNGAQSTITQYQYRKINGRLDAIPINTIKGTTSYGTVNNSVSIW